MELTAWVKGAPRGEQGAGQTLFSSRLLGIGFLLCDTGEGGGDETILG